MERLDTDGVFWLPTNPDDKVAGRLTFDPADGSELDLIGSFHELKDFIETTDSSLRINGIAGTKLLTLEDCWRTNAKMQIPGIAREKYYVGSVFSGANFDVDEPLEFRKVQMRLRHLDHWVGRTGTKLGYAADEDGKGFREINVNHTPPQNSSVNTAIGEVALSFSSRLRGDPITEVTVEQRCHLEFQPSTIRSLRYLLGVCSSLRDLITVCVGDSSAMESISLGRTPTDRLISLYTQLPGSDAVGKNIPHRTAMVLNFDDIGGLEGVGRWIEISDKYRIVTQTLLSHLYTPWMYADIRFFNSVTAAEALERIRRRKQNLKFNVALFSLARSAGSNFANLVGDVDKWVKEVIRTRDNNIVHRGLHEDETPRLTLLADSLYFLVVFELFRECKISDDVLSNICQHKRYSWLAEQLIKTP